MHLPPTDDIDVLIDLAEPECAEFEALCHGWRHQLRRAFRRLTPVLLLVASASTVVVVEAQASVVPAPPPQVAVQVAVEVAAAEPLPWFPSSSRQPPCEDGAGSATVRPQPKGTATARAPRTSAHQRYLDRAARLEAKGQWKAALLAYTWATKAAPRDAEAHVGRAMCLLELKRVRQARVAATRALKVSRDHGEATVIRGLIAQLSGQRDGARAQYTAYLAAHPDGTWATELAGVVERLGEEPSLVTTR